MLSGAAFNAFLKPLEEPPEHVVFILATTEPKRIPATVLSRCQRFDFKPIPPEMLTASLTEILTKEQVPFEPAALPLLVRAAEGSLRDALSLLDTAIAYGEGRLAEAGVAQLLGASSPVHVRAFVEALLGRDGGAALAAIDRAAGAGEDLAALCREVVEVGRRLLVLKAAPETSLPELTDAEAQTLRAAAGGVSLDELVYLLRAFLDADAEMRRSPHPRVELEIAAVRASRRPAPQALDALLAKVEDALARFRASGGAPGAAAPAKPTVMQESLLAAPAPASAPVAPPSPARRSAPVTPLPEREPSPPASAASSPVTDLGDAWQRVVDELKRKKPLVGTVLQGATALGLEGDVLMLSLVGNHFHRETLAERANRDLINQAVQQMIPGARRVDFDASGSSGGGARAHPAVQAALHAFQGEVVAVRPRAQEEGE